jgi:hypothetical protein
MIRELAESLLCLCPGRFRQLGFHRGTAAIAARRRRWAAAWQPHEAACRNFLLAHAPGGNQALLLGAGLCNDLPVRELAERYGQVRLADVSFHPSVRLLARRLRNVTLEVRDASGLLHRDVVDPDSLARIPDPSPGDETADFVASVNLASQLPLPFIADADGSETRAVREAVIRAHVGYLRRFACPGVLIAETVRVTGSNGIRREYVFPKGILPPPQASWSWDIAPPGETGRSGVALEIGAWTLGGQRDF